MNPKSTDTAVTKWRQHLFTLRARDQALTLTYHSLTADQTATTVKLQKRSQSKLEFLPCDGGGSPMFIPEAKTIMLRRSDFLRLHDYTLQHGPLRDFCLIRVPMKCGLRPGEIQHLRWENVDFNTQTLSVNDSKKHVICPVPMDLATADYLRQLKNERAQEWVIDRDPRSPGWRQLTTHLSLENLEHILKKWARLAGCETWQRMRVYDLRHFFAANWAYPPDGKRPGNLHALSKILRHSTSTTQIYLGRLVFYEDVQAEYNRLQTSPFVQDVPAVGNDFFDSNCRVCISRPTCKYVDQAMTSPWASGCRFLQKTVQKEVSKNE